MSRSSVLMVVGFLTLLVAFMGIPLTWLRMLLPIFGLAIIIIGFLMRTDRVAASKRDMPAPPVSSSNEVSSIA